MSMTMFVLGQIVVDVPDCPKAPLPNIDGIPTWVVGWGMGVVFVVLVVVCVSVAIVRYNAWENKASIERQRGQNAVEMAKQHKRCPTCGDVYNPTVASSLKEGNA